MEGQEGSGHLCNTLLFCQCSVMEGQEGSGHLCNTLLFCQCSVMEGQEGSGHLCNTLQLLASDIILKWSCAGCRNVDIQELTSFKQRVWFWRNCGIGS